MPNLTLLQLFLIAIVLLALIAGVVLGIKTGNPFMILTCLAVLVMCILELFGLP
jgi:hypothetical protein